MHTDSRGFVHWRCVTLEQLSQRRARCQQGHVPTHAHWHHLFRCFTATASAQGCDYLTAHRLSLWKAMFPQVPRSSLTDRDVLGLERLAVPHVLHGHHQVVVGGPGPDVSEAHEVFVLKENTHR